MRARSLRRRLRLVLGTLVAVSSSFLPPNFAWAVLTNVDQASDICAASADPCVLTQVAHIVSGSVLDFGTRALEVRGSGQLDVGAGIATIRCGQLTLATPGTAIALNGPGSLGTLGGLLTVEVKRRCSGNQTILCFSDGNCATAGAGTCTIGSGTANLSGKIVGSADTAASAIIRAAGAIAVSSEVQLNGTALTSDGGSLDLESFGAVTINAMIGASSGAQGTGGDIAISAATDVVVNDELDASGGDADGGTIALTADRDLTITADINASATAGGGYGGEIDVTVGRDLTITGGTSSNRVTLSTDGHESVDSLGGDGGVHDYYVGRNVYFGPFTRFTSDGSPPDGYGDTITVDANGNVLIDGDILARGQGTQGGGGELDLLATGQLEVAALADLDVSGGDGGGGYVSAFSDGDLDFSGSIDASSSNAGVAGDVDFESSTDAYISGSVTLAGTAGRIPATVATTGCRLNLLAGADIDNPRGRNTFLARERIAINTGATVLADSAIGSNRITYRTPAKPPVISGRVTPFPTLTVNRLLTGCPVCGNNEIDDGESCDDGNTIAGDGCNAECQDEGCIAETPGYPTVPLCSDGDACTLDPCDPQLHACTHVTSCDDSVDCTEDSCVNDACVHVPNDALCSSGTTCAVGFCNTVTNCVFTPVAGSCDDGSFCNGADSCGAGSCSQHAGSPCAGQPECQNLCDETADSCLTPAGTTCANDGRPCTADRCDGLGACVHPDQDVACDDGVFCNGADSCTAGQCDVHDGDPCATAGECRDTCNETVDACRTDQGVPCTDDGNFCTDDACSGSGSCAHDPYDRFASVVASVSRKNGPGNDRFALKAVLTAADVTAVPTSTGLQLDIVDGNGASVFAADLAANGFVDVKGDGSLYRFRDKNGAIAAANGIFLAIVKRNVPRGVVAVKLKGHEVELPAFSGKQYVSPALSFGVAPGNGPCFAANYVACKEHGLHIACRN